MYLKNRDEKLVNKAMKLTAYGLIGFGILFILSILFDVVVSIAVLTFLLLLNHHINIFHLVNNRFFLLFLYRLY